jgi:hypothetical protein
MIVRFPVGSLYSFSRILLVVLLGIISCFVDSSLSFLIHMFIGISIITAPTRMGIILVDIENISFEANLVT